VQSNEELLQSLREDEQRLQELARLVDLKLRERVVSVLNNVQSRIAILELRHGAGTSDATTGVRKEIRTPVEIPVRIRGLDSTGRLFDQVATTVDVTTTGARLRGVVVPLHRGCELNVQRASGEEPARFRVMWVAENGQGLIGIQLVEVGARGWDLSLDRTTGDAFAR
jgi:hypothetical protein